MSNDDRYELVGKRIKQAREEEKISQRELAEALGYESATAISLIEAGKRSIEVEVLDRISKILKRDIKFFMDQEDQSPTISYALRADKDLDKEDEEQIIKFIEFVKSSK